MRKLLNALRARLGYRGFEVGTISNPFEGHFFVAVKRSDGAVRIVAILQDYEDYDKAAEMIADTKTTDQVLYIPSRPAGGNDD